MALLILHLAAKALSMPIIPTKSSQKMRTRQLLMFKFITYVTLTITDPVSNGLYKNVHSTIVIHTVHFHTHTGSSFYVNNAN